MHAERQMDGKNNLHISYILNHDRKITTKNLVFNILADGYLNERVASLLLMRELFQGEK